LTSLPAEGEYLRVDDFFALDFFLVAFFVAITILLGSQMALVFGQVACHGLDERLDSMGLSRYNEKRQQLWT
jgi:hypothetical protein